MIVDIVHEDLDRVFTYRVPERMLVSPGMRVHVPFGRMKQVEGIVMSIEEASSLPNNRLREVIETLEDYPAILPSLMQVADYLHKNSFCTMAQALRMLYPPAMRKDRATEKKETVAVLKVPPELRLQIKGSQFRAPKRAAILSCLEESENGEVLVSELYRRLGNCRSSLNSLVGMGFVYLKKQTAPRVPYKRISSVLRQDPPLTESQRNVLEKLLPAVRKGNGRFLLNGVTGSGKTEIYIRTVRETVAIGKTAIVLVPEIALTPQMVSWFRACFGDEAAVLHSRLSPGERYDEWRRIRTGSAPIVIGARSAVFAPLQNIGVIIIDEEHEQSYQADNMPQYDAREIARFRCENENATLLLASATPSLRSFALANRGDLTLLEMTKRVFDRPLPTVRIIDMREELRLGNRSVFSGALLKGLNECMNDGKQAILFVNRRGHSTFVSCRSCGATLMCEHCDISMTYHQKENVLRCHYCGRERPVPTVCPECGSRYIRYFGIGTQKVEEEMHRCFPEARTLRMDNDTTKAKDAHLAILEQFRTGDANVLIGTQMIAKGLDFPNVTLVGIVAADVMLRLPDYRSSERTFQLLTQVAGRAGRADNLGTVYLQTYEPDHYAIQAASRQDYRSFYEQEMHYRRQALYPPFTFIARLVFESDECDKGRTECLGAKKEMDSFFSEKANLRRYLKALRVLPCPVQRLKDKYRWELVLKMIDQPFCREALEKMSSLANLPRAECRCIYQENPQSLM